MEVDLQTYPTVDMIVDLILEEYADDATLSALAVAVSYEVNSLRLGGRIQAHSLVFSEYRDYAHGLQGRPLMPHDPRGLLDSTVTEALAHARLGVLVEVATQILRSLGEKL